MKPLYKNVTFYIFVALILIYFLIFIGIYMFSNFSQKIGGNNLESLQIVCNVTDISSEPIESLLPEYCIALSKEPNLNVYILGSKNYWYIILLFVVFNSTLPSSLACYLYKKQIINKKMKWIWIFSGLIALLNFIYIFYYFRNYECGGGWISFCILSKYHIIGIATATLFGLMVIGMFFVTAIDEWLKSNELFFKKNFHKPYK